MNMTSLSRWGSPDLPVINPSMSRGPKIWRVKESSRKTRKLNLMLPSQLELKINSMMNLPAQGRTKEKGTMGNKKSGVLTAGRVFTLNMSAWRKSLMKQPLSLRGITSNFRRAFRGEITKIGNHSMRKVMPSWQALRSQNHCWLKVELRITWWLKKTHFHPWIPANPSPSTWEMTPPSLPKDKVL